MHRIAVLAFVACVSAEVFIESRCPNPKPVENFDFAAWGTGTWYEVARYQNAAERSGKCGWAEYILEGDTFKLKNLHVAAGKLAYVEGFGQRDKDAGTNGILEYNLPYGPGGSLAPQRLYILSTDYKKYGILYHCKYNEEKKIRQDLAWVVSRTKTLDSEKKTFVDNFIKESKILDSSKYVWPDFSDEACHYEA